MNLRFPEPQNRITALGEISIASAIPRYIGFLDFGQIGKLAEVAVPEIPIPLNNDLGFWQENIDNKLAVDNLLLRVIHAHAIENRTPSNLEAGCLRINFSRRHSLHDPSIATFIRTIINRSQIRRGTLKRLFANRTHQINFELSAVVRTIVFLGVETAFYTIKLIAASRTLNHLPRTAFLHLLAMVLRSALWTLLPIVCALIGAKYHGALSPSDKGFAAAMTGMYTTLVAPLSEIGTRQKRMAALLAGTWITGNVFHLTIIPWRVAKCTSN